MHQLLVFGSEDCPSWERTRELVQRVRDDDQLNVDLKLLDPTEHQEKFREYNLVICPSIVYDGDVISVGVPEYAHVKEAILQRKGE